MYRKVAISRTENKNTVTQLTNWFGPKLRWIIFLNSFTHRRLLSQLAESHQCAGPPMISAVAHKLCIGVRYGTAGSVMTTLPVASPAWPTSNNSLPLLRCVLALHSLYKWLWHTSVWVLTIICKSIPFATSSKAEKGEKNINQRLQTGAQ